MPDQTITDTASQRRFSKRWLGLGFIVLVPLLLYWLLAAQASWRPYTLVSEQLPHHDHFLIAYAPQGKQLAIASAHRMELWDISSSKLLHEIVLDNTGLEVALAFSPDSQQVVAVYGSGGNVERMLWDVSTDQLKRIPLRGWSQTQTCLFPTVNPTAEKRLTHVVVRARHTGDLTSWNVLLCDAQTGRMLRAIKIKTDKEPRSYALSLDSRTLALGCSSFENDSPMEVQVLDVPSGQQMAVMKADLTYDSPLTLSANGQLLAVGRKSGAVDLWSVQPRKLLHTLTGHQDAITDLTISPDGTLLSSSSEDKTIKLWHLPDGKLLRTLRGHTAQVAYIAFAPDGGFLASGSADGTVKLWRLR